MPCRSVMEGRAAREQFLNPVGAIQGGFLAAMLDDTLGPALVATLGPGLFAPTTDLHVQFLRPARPGRLTGRGRIVRRGDRPGALRITSGGGARPHRPAAGRAGGPASAA